MDKQKKWTKEEIKEKLEANNSSSVIWIQRGILAIYAKQTEDEKFEKSTNYNNNVGFTGVDAKILSSFAEQLIKGWTLSKKQIEIAKKKMPKYAGQLSKIANGII